MTIKIKILMGALLLASFATYAQTKLLRFPDIHGEEVVFCYAGDIWKAPVSGGVAIRLTAHPGQELFPKFSPDGSHIAFTGQYDGDEQVYVIPSAGEIPKQLTYYPASGPLPPRWGYDHQVYGWTPDGKSILFRSLRDANGGSTETALYTVAIQGGLPVKLPMPTSGAGDFSPDGSKMVYSPLFRDFRSWKRYEGGWAQNLYIIDLNSLETSDVSKTVRTERDPMWIGNAIFFSSDRDGTLNLYKFDIPSSQTTQLTTSDQWDVRWPSSDNKGKIVYEFGGELSVYDITSNSTTKISIQVPDDGLSMRPGQYPAYKNIEGFELAPKGQRALFVARGDIFTLPIEDGPTRNLTNSSNAHDREAVWSPDGKTIAYVSDKTGEEQIYLIDQLGKGEEQQLTTSFKGQLGGLRWSPDSKRIAFTQNNVGKLFVLDISTKKLYEAGDDEFGNIGDHMWSHDGNFLAFSMNDWNDFSSLYIYSVEDDKTRRITSERFREFEPVFDPEGRYLYFLSDRNYAPQISSWEWNFATNRMTGIYALALREDVENPFPPKSDEVSMEEEKEDNEKDGTNVEVQKLYIDFDGLADRVTRLPIDFENISGLNANKGHIFYVTSGQAFYGRSSYEPRKLNVFSMEEREGSVLVEDVGPYVLSPEGDKILVSSKGNYQLYDAKPKAEKKDINTKNMMVDRVPAQEWETIFWEVWRRYRDYFYVRNMHGYDWEAIGNQYAQLLQYVAHRSDLNYVISEMISELSVGHAYIQGGDFEIPDRPKVALGGMRFKLDPETGYYQISKIFKGDNEEPKYKAPLTEVGVHANVGDYVLAIDGEPLNGSDNPYRLLQHKTNPITLTLNSTTKMSGAREVKYDPIFSESNLLYLEWTEGNRQKVYEATDGRVGYMHIPDMGANGIYEFIKAFYSQIKKEGMVVDVRANGGGNVSQWIIERLDTKLLGTRFGYSSDKPRTYPYTVFHGNKVCLINQTSASDGDIFPHYFREAGLGPLIGKRTWGGVVGISSRGPLLDGGVVYVPLSATNNVKGEYIIEGKGVTPDIEVENDPASVIAGRDPQLERGIQEVLKMMEENPKKYPSKPEDPIKTE
jgi:tricorn protease